MPLGPDDIDTITFDSFSTLVFEMKSLTDALKGYTDDPLEVASMWRQRAVLYTLFANFFDDYETYYQMHRYGLEYALEYHDIDATAEDMDELNETFYNLKPFEDVDVIEQLDNAGYDTYIISNGDPAMLDGLLETTAIGPHINDTVSADEIKTFKPDSEIYELASERASSLPERMIHVSAGLFDVQGAQNIGMNGCWLNRKTVPFFSQQDPYGEQPDLIIESLNEIADWFC